jgi:hypothetical protein
MADLRPTRPGPARVAPKARRRRRGPGWLPNQHGAWAMLALPFGVGAVAAGPSWRYLPLLAAWLTGYLFFFAAGLWLRSRCKARYWPPVRAYGVLAATAGLVVVLVEPALLRWAVVFGPLLATSLWCSWRRADRTLLNDGATLVAAALMTVVVAGLGARPVRAAGLAGLGWLPGADQVRPWLLAGVLFLYFAGTVLYVKSMIRDRGDRARYALSVAFHAAAVVPAVAVGPWLGVLFVLLGVRAAVVPRRWPALTPALVGVGELGASLALAALLLV